MQRLITYGGMTNTSPYNVASGVDTSQPPYYTVAQAARRLQVSPSTIWRWIDAQKLPAYRVGEKAIRVRREDLDAMIRPIDGQSKAARGMESTDAHTKATPDASGPNGLMTDALTAQDIRQGLAAMRKAAASRAEQLERRGGVPFPSSVDLIKEIREEMGARQ
jgi:excisionase family DNA binding protein